MAITLISINIEMKKHLDTVQAFLEKEQPDVVCMQEVYEEDLRDLAKKLRMDVAFGQMALIGRRNFTEPPFMPWGIGILSGLPMRDIGRLYYFGEEDPEYVFGGSSNDYYRLFLHASIQKGGDDFIIGTTHFTWTPDGQADDLQRKDATQLLAMLKKVPGVVFCGDFNAPRGGEIFGMFAGRYKDNIPLSYTTSIDTSMHRLGDKLGGRNLMVDGLFTTSEYRCSNVRLQDGVSDHMAVIAEIARR